MRRSHLRLGFGVVAVAVVLVAGPLAPASAHPVDDGPSPTTTTVPNPADADSDIIPRPNSGRPPESADDRGGALQLAVLGMIVVGVGLILALVIRESSRRLGTTAPVRAGARRKGGYLPASWRRSAP